MKRLIAALIFSLVLALLGCTPFSHTYTVSGTVTDQLKQPLEGAQVRLGSIKVTTTAQGRFSFQVKEGTYELTASKAGYKSGSQTVGVYYNLTDLTLILIPEAPAGYTLEIRIVDSTDDSQVSNPTTKLTNAANGQVMGTTQANPARFIGLPFSTYVIEITHADYQKSTTKLLVRDDTLHSVPLYPNDPATAAASGTISLQTGSSSGIQSGAAFPYPTHELPPAAPGIRFDGILVRFKDRTGKGKVEQTLSRVKSGTVKQKGEQLYQLKITGDPDQTLEILRQNPDVEYAQFNYLNQLSSVPNDELYSNQWNLTMIDMPGAWDVVKGQDRNVVIAVLDTGIWSHSDLNSNIAAGYDSVDNDYDPYDDVSSSKEGSHGTHVASIIGAVTNNSSLLAGAGWNIRVMPVKVFSRTGSGLGASDADVAEGIKKAVDMGANVINLSLGNHDAPKPAQHPVFEDALQYAYQHGVTVVAATGNRGDWYIDYPASSRYTLAVGAVGHDQQLASYSNYGTGLDLVAPGGHGANQDDWAHWIVGLGRYNGQESLMGMTGTSQATPHVSAVAGLLYTLGVRDPDQVMQILVDSAVDCHDPTRYGAGILNAEAAIRKASNGNSVSITDVVLYAATPSADGNSWRILSSYSGYSANVAGEYVVPGIPPDLNDIYVIGLIDLNNNRVLEDEDYFGSIHAGSPFQAGERRTGLDFSVDRISNLSSNRKNELRPHLIFPTGNR